MKRNGRIDVLRVFFTVLVMLFHAEYVQGGYIAVEYFFIVSGFLMASSMRRYESRTDGIGRQTVEFVLKKAWSVYPFYLAAWIISFVITALVKHWALGDIVYKFVLSPFQLLMLQMAGCYDMGHHIYASWYLSAMFLAMFMLFPLRRKNADVFDRIIAPIMVLAFVGLVYQTGRGMGNYVKVYDRMLHAYNGLIRALAEIAAGCISYRIARVLARQTYTPTGKILLALTEGVGYVSVFWCATHFDHSALDLALLLWLVILVAITFSGTGIPAQTLVDRYGPPCAKASLLLYLNHEVVRIQILNNYRGIDRGNVPLYLLLFAVMTVVVSVLCYLFGSWLAKALPRLKDRLVVS